MLLALVTGAVVAMIYQGVFTATLSYLVETHNSSTVSLAGFVFGAASLAGILQAIRWSWEPWLAPWFGRFSDGQLSRGKTLAFILLVAAALLAILPFQLPIEIWLAAVIGMQVTATALSTIGDAAAADVAATQFRTTVMTLYVMATDVGAALGPFLGYLMAQWWGVGSMYWSAAALLAGLAIWWLAEKPRGSSIA